MQRVGRQVSALRAGRLDEWAKKADEAARSYMTLFAEQYGTEGYRAMSFCYRMAQMDDPKRSLWMEAAR